MRFEDDHRTIVLPTIGALRSKENTRRVQRHIAKNNARLLNCTLSERWGRLFISCQLAVRTNVVSNRAPSKPDAQVGVDLGLRSLATIAFIVSSRAEIVLIMPVMPRYQGRERH